MANIVDSIVGVLASSKHIIVSSDLTGNTSVTSTHPLLALKNNNSDSHGALLRLQKDTDDEANNDVLGVIQFTGNNDSGVRHNFGSIDCQQTSVSNGSEVGKIRFKVATSNSGTETEVLSIQGGSNITPKIDSQVTINGSLKAKLYSGNDPYELTKPCNTEFGYHFGYTNHILDKNYQYEVNTVSGPFKISNPTINNESKAGLSAGTGITGATNEVYKSWMDINNSKVKIYIFIDITGLNSNVNGDIIGKDATANCHIGQIPSNIDILETKVRCIQAPVTGSTDIDFYSASEATGTEDAAISGLTETKLLENGEAWTTGMTKLFTTQPASGQYLYLVNGGSTVDNTYTFGQYLIEFTGRYKLTPGSGVYPIGNSNYYSWIEEEDDDKKVKTNIIIDLTDLESENIFAAIIGNEGASNCHFGQINYSQTGIIYKAVITCIETPAGGEVDIDVYQSTVSTGTEEALVTSLAGATQLVNTNTDWTVDTSKIFTTNPSDTNYLYLAVGTSDSPTDSTYTMGKFLIEMYGTKISDVPSMTGLTTGYDADFGSGFKMMTGSTTGNYIDLCSQEAAYTCANGRKWWIETEFKLDDHDGTEFFFGIAEPSCGSEDLIYVASTTFVKAAGKDRLGLSKLTHNADLVTAASTNNTSGSESISLSSSVDYTADNNILKLGIYWDGNSTVYFYGNSRATGSSIANMSLIYTHTVNEVNVVPNDSNNYLRLFMNNGEASTKTSVINYIRGKVQKSDATSLYTY